MTAKRVAAVVLTAALAIAGCVTPGVDSKEMQKAAEQSPSAYTATQSDMQLLLGGGKGACRQQFSRYAYSINTGDRTVTGIVDGTGPVSIAGRAVTANVGNAKGSFEMNGCGGEGKVGNAKVLVVPAAYFPIEYFPALPEGVAISVNSNGLRDATFHFPQDWSKEKRLLAHMNINRRLTAERFVVYATFATVPDMVSKVQEFGYIATMKGQKMYAIRTTDGRTFALVGYQEGEER